MQYCISMFDESYGRSVDYDALQIVFASSCLICAFVEGRVAWRFVGLLVLLDGVPRGSPSDALWIGGYLDVCNVTLCMQYFGVGLA